MKQAYAKEELPTSAEMVWQLIRNFKDISSWAPGYDIVEVNGEGPGSVHRVRTLLGLATIRLIEQEESRYQFSYAMPDILRSQKICPSSSGKD